MVTTVRPTRVGVPDVLDGVKGSEPPQEISRRTFQTYVAASLSAFIGLVVGLPVVGYLAAPLARKPAASWLSLGKMDAFKPGEPKLVSVSLTRQDGWRQITEARACWVMEQGNGQFTVFNGRCTHLGCLVSWISDQKVFRSPCHDGVFSLCCCT